MIRLMKGFMCALVVVLSLAATIAPAQTVSYFRVGGGVNGIALAGGNIWFTSSEGIGFLTPRGELTTYPIPSGASAITAGPNHDLWFAVAGGVSRMDMETSSVLTFNLPSGQPFSLAIGSDNQLWFGYSGGVGVLSATGAFTLFPIQKQNDRAPDVLSLAEGPDGNIWFIEYPFNQVGRITSGGAISGFATYPSVCCGPVRIASGPDAGLWLSFNGQRRLARLSTAGTIMQIYEMGNGSVPAPLAITSGPDGRMWFGTELGLKGSVIGNVSSDGTINTTITVPAEIAYGFLAMTAGPDGNVWVTLAPVPLICESVGFCPTPDPTPLAIARVNLVNPAPLITAIDRTFDPATNAPSLKVVGLGFVPDSVIRWNDIDQTTIYLSPFELSLPPAEASQAAYGGTFLVRNAAPGGGASPAFTLKPATPVRRHAAR